MRLYRSFIRLPYFKGKGRLDGWLRERLYARDHAPIMGGLVMSLDAWEYAQQSIIKDGHLEPLTTRRFGDVLKEGDTYVDVGAHVGFHTLIARKLIRQSGRVIAVEPQPYNASKILLNWDLNGFANIVLYVAAAGAEEGSIGLFKQPASDASRLSLALPSIPDQQPQQFRVPVLTLTGLLAEQQLSRVRLLKIDVEGYELEVLHGAGDKLRTFENIVLEVLDQDTERARELRRLLTGTGYELLTVEGALWDGNSPLPENNLWARAKGSA